MNLPVFDQAFPELCRRGTLVLVHRDELVQQVRRAWSYVSVTVRGALELPDAAFLTGRWWCRRGQGGDKVLFVERRIEVVFQSGRRGRGGNCFWR